MERRRRRPALQPLVGRKPLWRRLGAEVWEQHRGWVACLLRFLRFLRASCSPSSASFCCALLVAVCTVPLLHLITAPRLEPGTVPLPSLPNTVCGGRGAAAEPASLSRAPPPPEPPPAQLSRAPSSPPRWHRGALGCHRAERDVLQLQPALQLPHGAGPLTHAARRAHRAARGRRPGA